MPSEHFEDLELVLIEPEPLPPAVAEAIRLLLLSSQDSPDAFDTV